jgi:hypothetical protein
MMRSDIKIAIAYTGDFQGCVASDLRNKLQAYAKYGYPVTVSFVQEKIDEIVARQKAKDAVEIKIADEMESYFSDFDFAIFLFDTIGNAISTAKNLNSPLISSNIVFEYGLASSAFINKEIKSVRCFAPQEISGNSLKYIKGLNIITYDEGTKFNEINWKYADKAKDFDDDVINGIDQITDVIINFYIHEIDDLDGFSMTKLFYGLPDKLPKLIKDNEGNFHINDPETEIDNLLGARNPLELSPDNTYWASIKSLRPSGTIGTLSSQSPQALNKLFIKEFDRFSVLNQVTNNEYITARKILYIVDRAVFLMYLREEDYWDNVVNNLKTEVNNEYYRNALKALNGVFEYQKRSRPTHKEKPLSKSLLKDKHLENIIDELSPIVSIGADKGNRMLYCLAADYSALANHKIATRILSSLVGVNDLYLDNFDQLEKLSLYINENVSSEEVFYAIDHLINAIDLFVSVTKTQELLQTENNGYYYLWKSYALYNQARCEFLLNLIVLLYKRHNKSITGKLRRAFEVSTGWKKNLENAITSRKLDGTYPRKTDSINEHTSANNMVRGVITDEKFRRTRRST